MTNFLRTINDPAEASAARCSAREGFTEALIEFGRADLVTPDALTRWFPPTVELASREDRIEAEYGSPVSTLLHPRSAL